MTPRRAGIIAAGLGARFTAGGISTPKPMIAVAGRPLIHWAVSQFVDAGFSGISAIFNETHADECAGSLQQAFPDIDFEVVRRDTGSSFESFVEVLARGGGEAMLVTSVDAIMRPGALRSFVDEMLPLPDDALVLGVSSHVDDEKPLYVEVGDDRQVTAVGVERSAHVTCGVYCLPARLGREQAGTGHGALRSFLGALVAHGTPAFAIDCGKTIDVDRPQDLAEAERWLDENAARQRGT